MRRQIIVASLVGGLFFGLIDSTLTLARFPNPAFTHFVVGYVIGPLVGSLAWSGLIALFVRFAPLGHRRNATRASIVAAILGITWWLGITAVTVAGPGSPVAKALAVLIASVIALSLVVLTVEATRRICAASPRARAAILAAPLLAVAGAGAAITPSGLRALRSRSGDCTTDTPRGQRPNILLITIDTLRLDSARRMATYQWLASSGITHAQHVTSSPWTLPSIASLLTGILPHQHGAGAPLSSTVLLLRASLTRYPTIAEHAARLGYFTMATVTNPFLSAPYGIDRGFCSFENVTMEGEAVRRFRETTALRLLSASSLHTQQFDRAKDVLDRAADRIASRPTKGPFFHWVHLSDPHAPYGDRDDIPSTFATDLLAFQGEEGITAPFSGLARIRAGELRPNREEQERIRSFYEADVAYLDQHLISFLSWLHDRRILDDTVVILSSDHGEEFWEHGGAEHGRTLFDEVMRVPLVIRPPGGHEPVTINHPTAATQVFDLVMGIARDNAHENEYVIPPSGPVMLGGALFGEDVIGVRTGDFKYIHQQHGSELLFDLRVDRGELQNIAVVRADVVEGFRQLVADAGVTSTDED